MTTQLFFCGTRTAFARFRSWLPHPARDGGEFDCHSMSERLRPRLVLHRRYGKTSKIQNAKPRKFKNAKRRRFVSRKFTGSGGVDAVPCRRQSGRAKPTAHMTQDMNYFIACAASDGGWSRFERGRARRAPPGTNHPIAGAHAVFRPMYGIMRGNYDGTKCVCNLKRQPEAPTNRRPATPLRTAHSTMRRWPAPA